MLLCAVWGVRVGRWFGRLLHRLSCAAKRIGSRCWIARRSEGVWLSSRGLLPTTPKRVRRRCRLAKRNRVVGLVVRLVASKGIRGLCSLVSRRRRAKRVVCCLVVVATRRCKWAWAGVGAAAEWIRFLAQLSRLAKRLALRIGLASLAECWGSKWTGLGS